MSFIESSAILVAAGQGERLASCTDGTPKQFIKLNKTPLFIWSLTTLVKHSLIAHVFIAVPNEWCDRTAELIAEFLPECKNNISILVGGSTRQQSVYLALEKIASSESPPHFILVHDAVRPFITNKIIDQILQKLQEKLQESTAITLGIPLSDSIKEVSSTTVLEDLDRSKFILVQTPQAAKLSLLLEAHRDAKLKQRENTDDASIIRAYGGTVTVLTGSKFNFKITEPEDLALAQAFVKYHHLSAANVCISNGDFTDCLVSAKDIL